MKSKVISLTLIICMIAGIFAFAPMTAGASSGICGDDLTWELENGTLVIKGTGEMSDWDEYSVPWSGRINNVIIREGVTTIGDYAFSGCSQLSTITIPDTLRSIGYYAFNGCNLYSVSIEDVSSWCNIEFMDYTSTPLINGGYLEVGYDRIYNLEIPDSVTTIGNYTFYGCRDLKSVILHDGVTSIGDYAFAYCSDLESVDFSDGITSIGNYAFAECSSLTKVIIPDSVTTISSYAFYFCSNLERVAISQNITEISDGIFSNCSKLAKVTIPECVTTIGYGAFFYCSGLKSVTFPDSVISIGKRAFQGCSGLTNIAVGGSLATFEADAFTACNKLTNIFYAGSEEQWNQIPGTNNSWLKSAIKHYNFNTMTANFSYIQSAVSGLEQIEGYSEYMSRATKEFIFPGLNDGFVPQGIAYREDRDEFYLTAYDGTGSKCSVLMVVDGKTGKYKKEFSVINIDGSDNKGHLGGVAVTSKNVYLTSGKNLLRISLSTIDCSGTYGNIQVEEKIPLAIGDAGISYVNYDRNNNILWTGNFYYFWDSDYRKKAYPKYNTLLVGYEMTKKTENGFKNSMKASSDSSFQYVPDIIFDLDDYDRIQGVAFTKDTVVLSQSYGRGNKSKLHFLDYPNVKLPEKNLTIDGQYVPVCEVDKKNKITVFPMSEGIEVRNGKLYSVYESAAKKYLDGGKDKTEYVWGYRLDSYTEQNYPVIVLPGIMGSTMKDTGGLGVPVLTSNSGFISQSDLVIADTTAASTGADNLIKKISSSGDYVVYPCPYDWRLSIDDISEKYLEPLIKKARKETGSEKVILVSHSMGGLVARSYIQSGRYQNDVDSLYMIGTPNEGSTAMVPLSIYGVPFDAAQATVMAYNYNKMTGEDYNKASAEEVKSFIRNKVISTSQLLPAYDRYYFDVENNTFAGTNLNQYLTELNSNALICGRYQPITGKNKSKVRTILFASEDVDTPHSLEVVYKGSTPHLKYTQSFMKNKAAYITQAALSSEPYVEYIDLTGDGTVLTNSAIVSGKLNSIWTIDRGDYGKHMKMFGGLSNEISEYLETMPTMNLMSAQERGETHSLQIDVSGADASINVNDELFSVDNECCYIENPEDGEYVINCVKKADAERITIQFLYTNGDETTQKTISFLNDECFVSFNVSAGAVEYVDKTVAGLRSVNSGGYAKLLWNEVSGAVSYKIYKKNFSESAYTLHSETEETEYTTNDSWTYDFSDDCWCYYVIPMFGDETVGGYSESARNYNNTQAAFDYTINKEDSSVSFIDLSTGDISSWKWDFNSDGVIDSEEQSPTYKYEDDGVYSVTLTVSGASGTSVVTCNDAIKIGVYPLKIVVQAEEKNIKIGENTTLSAYILMSDESQTDAKDITFVSSDSSVLLVNENTVTAQSIGSANIIASAEGLTGNIELHSVCDEVAITLTSEGYGFAEGSGNYQIGETILVSAVPIDNEEFLGWYKGDECVSTDKDYWFEVTEAAQLKAVFTKTNTVCVNALVDYCRYDNNEVLAKITYNYVFEDCIVFLAIYDKGGKLQKLTSQPVTKNSEYSEFGISTEDVKGYDFKFFFWKSMESIDPVGKALKGTIK